jgi:hypothetical protein
MNLDQQLVSLLDALDEVIDLERGLADATLPGAHAKLMVELDDALDLEAGLARMVPQSPRAFAGLIAMAEELSGLPAAERLAARAWLPVSLLIEAYILAKHVSTVRALADELDDVEKFVNVRASARMDVRRVLHDLDQAGFGSTEVHTVARQLSILLRLTRGASRARRQSALLREHLAERLTVLLVEIDRRAAVHSGLVDGAFADALLGPLNQLVSAVTDVVGADLTSADLNGLPLHGVRWSSGTRWPEDWREWVRDNSEPVSADVFEIRSGKAGSWLPT